MNELPTVYPRQRVTGDLKVLVMRSWHVLGGGRDLLCGVAHVGASHTDMPLIYFLSSPHPPQSSLI